MPKLEINATQPWLIAPDGNVAEITGRADYVLANPPFNDSDWFRKDNDVRWQFGVSNQYGVEVGNPEQQNHHAII